jgi:hypothetical protein
MASLSLQAPLPRPLESEQGCRQRQGLNKYLDDVFLPSGSHGHPQIEISVPCPGRGSSLWPRTIELKEDSWLPEDSPISCDPLPGTSTKVRSLLETQRFGDFVQVKVGFGCLHQRFHMRLGLPDSSSSHRSQPDSATWHS